MHTHTHTVCQSASRVTGEFYLLGGLLAHIQYCNFYFFFFFKSLKVRVVLVLDIASLVEGTLGDHSDSGPSRVDWMPSGSNYTLPPVKEAGCLPVSPQIYSVRGYFASDERYPWICNIQIWKFALPLFYPCVLIAAQTCQITWEMSQGHKKVMSWIPLRTNILLNQRSFSNAKGIIFIGMSKISALKNTYINCP